MTLALAIESSCTVPFSFLQIDLKKLPELWRLVLRSSVNDYLQFEEDHQSYRDAFWWLFREEFDSVLAGREIDIMSLYVAAKALCINIDRLRFEIQRLKDNISGIDELNEEERDPRGRKRGHLKEEGFEKLLDRCKRF